MAGSHGELWAVSWDWVVDCILKRFVKLLEGSGDDGVECLEIFEGPSFSEDNWSCGGRLPTFFL